MADNVTVDNGTGSDYVVATDEVGARHIQIVKLAHGADGALDGLADDASPLPVDAHSPPQDEYSYTQAGVIAQNTILLSIDCAKLRALSLQCTSMGTTGVVTPEWSNDGSTWVGATLAPTSSTSGGVAATFNATGLWTAHVIARHFRLRMSTATTAGTTTIRVHGFNVPVDLPYGSIASIASSITPGTGSTNLGKAEDSAHASGHVGVMALGVRNDAHATLATTDLDYTPIAVDGAGRVQVTLDKVGAGDLALGAAATAASIPVNIASDQTVPVTANGAVADGAAASGAGNPVLIAGQDGTNVQSINTDSTGRVHVATIATSIVPGTAATNLGKAQDSAMGATDTGVANLMVRRDAPTNLTPAAGDYGVPQINSQGAQYVHPTFAGSAAASVAQIISAASANATSIKASAGVVTTIAAVNNGTAWRYLKLHNTSTAPTAGSGVVATYGLPPGGGITLAFPTGLAFSTGIGATITAGIAAADTAVIGANEVAATITYH